MWLMILYNLSLIFIGYFIGSLNISILISKTKQNRDIRSMGSGNAGATNALRVYGKKIGFLIFLFDFFKCLIPILLIGLLAKYIEPQSSNIFYKNYIIPQSIGLAVIIGHIFPLYHGFKGGKGAACFAGLISSINIILFIAGVILFLSIAFLTKIVSVATLISTLILTGCAFIPWIATGSILSELNRSVNEKYWLIGIICCITYLLVLYAHRQNIIRLFKGKENSFKNKYKIVENEQK
ncbi:glycerol-3-phosphate 1-O-acyltransferase PlsY [Mycoplasma elephantis]|uniref:glycerol-3-phosphate 1-O-acyltransferase PlsY n=1 Tax=Mycoplasma elephantis TaxID=114882 RepID=UPI00068E6344|nr:glycerol-3-phosphate 1-O-acyltransferase PlsY [Mycoplasma elephantis]